VDVGDKWDGAGRAGVLVGDYGAPESGCGSSRVFEGEDNGGRGVRGGLYGRPNEELPQRANRTLGLKRTRGTMHLKIWTRMATIIDGKLSWFGKDTYWQVLLLLVVGVVNACASGPNLHEIVRTDNRVSLNRLALGMTREKVTTLMGEGTYRIRGHSPEIVTDPYRVESYPASGSVFVIIFYYTDIKKRDGAITDDELTPLVLKDDRLVGWGWSYWESTATQFNIKVRR
jgi:hypothetical protein